MLLKNVIGDLKKLCEYAIENGGSKDGVLIEILHDIQAEENYLPKEIL